MDCSKVHREDGRIRDGGCRSKRIQDFKQMSLLPVEGIRKHRGLLRCPNCNKTMNADTGGALSITGKTRAIIPSPIWRDRDNGLMADLLLLWWDG